MSLEAKIYLVDHTGRSISEAGLPCVARTMGPVDEFLFAIRLHGFHIVCGEYIFSVFGDALYGFGFVDSIHVVWLER